MNCLVVVPVPERKAAAFLWIAQGLCSGLGHPECHAVYAGCI